MKKTKCCLKPVKFTEKDNIGADSLGGVGSDRSHYCDATSKHNGIVTS